MQKKHQANNRKFQQTKTAHAFTVFSSFPAKQAPLQDMYSGRTSGRFAAQRNIALVQVDVAQTAIGKIFLFIDLGHLKRFLGPV